MIDAIFRNITTPHWCQAVATMIACAGAGLVAACIVLAAVMLVTRLNR